MARIIFRYLLAVAGLLVIGAIAAFLLLRASLPELDGVVLIEAGEISADVTIARDTQGIATITAANRADLAYGTGFAHAQDRFFQMDLTRRNAAGELAALVGSVAVPRDRENRLHRFRARAALVLRQAGAEQRAIIESYARGVNAGLNSLAARPFEYFLLGASPEPWRPEDSMLVVYAMFLDLNDERALRDIRRGFAATALPPALYRFIYPDGSDWDAPLMGAPRPVARIPGPEAITLTGDDVSRATAGPGRQRVHPSNADEPVFGSNNWAVAGRLSDSGAAIVANDMHLGLSAPNVFYRARMRFANGSLDLNGVTLPGAPVLVAGSNGRVAWGNTNSYGDWSDAVIITPGDLPGTYLTAAGPKEFVEHVELIDVAGDASVEYRIRETIWGPVLDDDPDPERTLVVSWIAHHPHAVTLDHLDLEHAGTVDEALDIANRIGMPPQNFVVGDRDGNIGWTIAGKIPVRSGYDPMLPADWSTGSGWQGWLPAPDYPRVVNPVEGRIWSANSRVADGDALNLIGDGGYDFAARARQIRDGLRARDSFAAEDMLAIQLDDRALLLSRWRDLLLDTLDDEALRGNAARAKVRSLVENWLPRAAPESVGYRIVRAFRREVRLNVFDMLIEPVVERFGEDVGLRISNQFEAPLWALVNEKPPHLLTARFPSWRALLLESIDNNIDYFNQAYEDGLENRTWGEYNTASLRHPLSGALPFISEMLDMPAEPLHGDSNLPRAQGPTFGASERFAVAPGHEEAGYLHMPTGQSGHPLSANYRRGHEDWVLGRATRFLPGDDSHTLVLRAGRPGDQ